MEKNLLLNIQLSLVYIRHEITDRLNVEILEIVLDVILNNQTNLELLHKLSQLNVNWVDSLKSENSIRISSDYSQIASKIITICVLSIIDCLKADSFNDAYLIVDNTEQIPQIFAEGQLEDLYGFWRIYIRPLKKVMGNDSVMKLKELLCDVST